MDLDQMAYPVPKAEVVEIRPPGGVSADLCSRRKRPCHIFPEEGSHVDGVLWSLTGDCEKSLDLYEGYPDFYDKQESLSRKRWKRDQSHCLYHDKRLHAELLIRPDGRT